MLDALNPVYIGDPVAMGIVLLAIYSALSTIATVYLVYRVGYVNAVRKETEKRVSSLGHQLIIARDELQAMQRLSKKRAIIDPLGSEAWILVDDTGKPE